jgi:hypothetical protein
LKKKELSREFILFLIDSNDCVFSLFFKVFAVT